MILRGDGLRWSPPNACLTIPRNAFSLSFFLSFFLDSPMSNLKQNAAQSYVVLSYSTDQSLKANGIVVKANDVNRHKQQTRTKEENKRKKKNMVPAAFTCCRSGPVVQQLVLLLDWQSSLGYLHLVLLRMKALSRSVSCDSALCAHLLFQSVFLLAALHCSFPLPPSLHPPSCRPVATFDNSDQDGGQHSSCSASPGPHQCSCQRA